ncbi:hypothetical protein CSK29544_00751 [Cronobacter sakazakii]|nr:hypothetical protein CSK29544_00751 [Cronobacter sakazakii]
MRPGVIKIYAGIVGNAGVMSSVDCFCIITDGSLDFCLALHVACRFRSHVSEKGIQCESGADAQR